MSSKIAVLIDVENISYKYIDVALKELKQYGDLIVQRMYGDFSNPNMQEWSKKGLEYAIMPIHQARHNSCKNASDIMLVIDAMDILFQGVADIFCIISSDSDYTRLVSRLREGGKKVVGMGMSNASQTFITACNEYKFLDKIHEEENDVDEEVSDAPSAVTPLGKIKTAINKMLQQAENCGEQLNMGLTKSLLQREFPDFDERNYGYIMFRTFIENETKLKVNINGSVAYIVRVKGNKKANTEKIVEEFIVKRAKNAIDLGQLGTELHNKFPDFHVKDLGYSQLSKYVQSIPNVSLSVKKKRVTVHCK